MNTDTITVNINPFLSSFNNRHRQLLLCEGFVQYVILHSYLYCFSVINLCHKFSTAVLP